MAEYGQTLSDAVFRFPLAAAFALLPARGERLGHEAKAANHADRAYLTKQREVMSWLARHFTIQAKRK